MSRPAPRPSAARPSARPGQTSTQSGPASAVRKGPSIEELRNLPATEDGATDANLDPGNVSSGKVLNEKCTVVEAKFVIQDWKKADGTYATRADGSPCYPEIRLRLQLRRAGQTEEDRTYRHEATYTGNVGAFCVSPDGNKVQVRKSVIKDGGVPPKFRKDDEGQMLWDSFAKAGIPVAALKEHGAAALVGKIAMFRSRDVEIQTKKGPINVARLLVDYIDGVTAPATSASAPSASGKPESKSAASPAASSATHAPATAPAASAPAAASDDVNALAEDAILKILAKNGNQLDRNSFTAKLLGIDDLKGHPRRGAILQLLRTDEPFTALADAGKIVIDEKGVIVLV